jgi:hypothetical protein
MRRGGLIAAVGGLALGCGGANVGRGAESLARTAPDPSPPWALVYVTGVEGVLERLDAVGASEAWSEACSGSCGEYVPAAAIYRLRRHETVSTPFSLPPPDMGRVVLRFDEDGRVWAHPASGVPRPAQPFVPQLVLFLRR